MGAYGSFRVDPVVGLIYGKRGRPVGSCDSSGYLQVTVIQSGRRILRSAHRWIWEHARGPIPDDREINHRNGVKTDNRIANLELVTHRRNIEHAYEYGLKSNRGERHPNHRLTAHQVQQIRARADGGESHLSLAAEFGMSRRHINDIARRVAWAHLGD